MQISKRFSFGWKRSQLIFASAMVLPAIIILSVLFVYPLFLAVKISFYDIHTILGGDKFVGLKITLRFFKMRTFGGHYGAQLFGQLLFSVSNWFWEY